MFQPNRESTAKVIASITLGAALAAVALYFIFPTHRVPTLSAKDISLRAIQADTLGIEKDTGFILTSTKGISVDDVKEVLKVNPQTELTYTQKSANEIEFVATKPLTANKVYQFSVPTTEQKLSWAFQVKGEFSVTGTLPDTKQTGVPLDTGIEITFTHENFKNFEQFISISPKVEGRFEKHKKVLVFVPKKLETKTIYTVTVKKGLPLDGSPIMLQEDKVIRFETASSEAREPSIFELSANEMQFDTVNDQVMTIFGNSLNTGDKIEATIFQFSKAQDYIDSYKKLLGTNYWSTFNKYQFGDISKIATKKSVLNLETKESSGQSLVLFPEKLQKGLYLIALKHPAIDEPRYAWVQVTDIGSYIQLNKNNAIVWSHDLKTKNPSKNAKVTFSSGATATTDNQGMAIIPVPEEFHKAENGISTITVTSSNNDSVIAFVNNYYEDKRTSQDFWSYISTDRPTYKQTDSFSYWGVAKSRRPEEKVTEVHATFRSTSYDYEFTNGDGQPKLFDTTLPVTANGTFTGEWKLQNIPTGSYIMEVTANGIVIATKWISIEQYIKPAYAIDIDSSRENYFTGEKARINIFAHFFDGTAVANKRIRVTMRGYQNVEKILTTDGQGKTFIDFIPPASETVSNYPRYETIQATPESNEEGEISSDITLFVYTTDIKIETDTVRKNGKDTLNILVRKIDLTKDDMNGEVIPNYPVTLSPFETHYEKNKTGENYDFISKKVIPIYQYNAIKTLGTVATLTTDKNGKIAYTFDYEEGKFKTVEIEAKDSLQHIIKTTAYSYDYSGYMYFGESVDVTPSKSKDGFAINEKVELRITKEELPAPKGNYLYLKTNWEQTKGFASSDPNFSTTFGDGDSPGFSVDVISFTGSTYTKIGTGYAMIDQKQKDLDIEIQTDKTRYRPGENVELTVKTKKDGKNVSGDVNINLIDEAYYKLYYGTVDPLRSIYGNNMPWYSRQFTFYSHVTMTYGGGAEKGGGGGDDVRSNFKDKALFRTVTTDGSGTAKVSFKLPDNITSWRATAQGVDSNMNVGVSMKAIPVGLPFFIDAVMAPEFIVSDKPILQVASYGDAITSGNEVTYSYAIPGLTVGQETVTGKGLGRADIPLPTLKIGKYKVTISATTKGKDGTEMKDAIVREFTVIESRLSSIKMSKMDLAGAKTVPNEVFGSTSEVTMKVQEAEKARAYETLWNMIDRSGARLDQQAAEEKSVQILKNFFKEEVPELSTSVSLGEIYQAPSGGMRLLPYASDDLELSAKTALLSGTSDTTGISKENLRLYFMKILSEEQAKKFPLATRERFVMAVSGLAALNEPILLTLQNLAKEANLTPIEKLYIAAGAMAIGDQQTAENLAKDLVTNNLEKINDYSRLKVGKDNDDILAHTALMAVIAADINLSEFQNLATYIAQQPGNDILTSLEQVSIIEKRLPFIRQEDATFDYSLNGKNEHVTLKNNESFSVNLSTDMLKSLTFANPKGALTATFLYHTLANKSQLKSDPNKSNIKISHTYQLHGKPTTSWSTGDIVFVDIQPSLSQNALEGCYTITEQLPSNLKPLSWNVQTLEEANQKEYYGSRPYAVNGQTVKYCVSKGYKPRIHFPVRVINKGTFTAEPTVIQMSSKPDIVNSTNETTITVK